MHKLVSIITPCYNGEKYLDRYFNSILAQTYPAIEVIFVNDGSRDRTEEMALEYGEKLKARGYQFTYIYQQNAGQSAAINQGLKVFKGEFLNWTDSDNYIPVDSIEKRVACFEKDPDLGLVIGRTVVVDDIEYNQERQIKETGMDRTAPQQMIVDLLKGYSNCTCCCSTMVRSSMFRDSMPDPPQIEAPREIGQNFQLFIPIMFNNKAVYVQDVLGYYVTHKDSHSRSRKSFEQKLHTLDVANETLTSISKRIKVDDSQREWFINKIAVHDCKNRLDVMQHYKRKDGLGEIIRTLKRCGAYDLDARITVLKVKYPFFKKIGDRFWKWKNR